LAMSSAAEPVMPAAHTNVRGSADRSMCFLSDDSSHEIDRYVSSEHLMRISSAAIRFRADPTTAQDLRSGAYSSASAAICFSPSSTCCSASGSINSADSNSPSSAVPAPPAARPSAHAKQDASGDLAIEGLRGGNRHLDVATVGRIQHAIRLGRQIAASAVDDRDDDCAALPDQVYSAVGVSCGAGLADRDH